MVKIYFSVMWLVITVLAVGILVVTGMLGYCRRRLCRENATVKQQCANQPSFLGRIRWMSWAAALALTAVGVGAWYWEHLQYEASIAAYRKELQPYYDAQKLWEAPAPFGVETDEEADLIAYGRNLIANTQDYVGEQRLVRPRSVNGLNCQDCHLEAGAKPFGNDSFTVAGTYPQWRARSGSLETIPKRVNDCFERSLNGAPLDTNSREMKAIVAYMRWLGTGIPKGEKPSGTGLVQVSFLNRAADPAKGEVVYAAKCAPCHGEDGRRVSMPVSARRYPPLRGDRSYKLSGQPTPALALCRLRQGEYAVGRFSSEPSIDR